MIEIDELGCDVHSGQNDLFLSDLLGRYSDINDGYEDHTTYHIQKEINDYKVKKSLDTWVKKYNRIINNY